MKNTLIASGVLALAVLVGWKSTSALIGSAPDLQASVLLAVDMPIPQIISAPGITPEEACKIAGVYVENAQKNLLDVSKKVAAGKMTLGDLQKAINALGAAEENHSNAKCRKFAYEREQQLEQVEVSNLDGEVVN